MISVLQIGSTNTSKLRNQNRSENSNKGKESDLDDLARKKNTPSILMWMTSARKYLAFSLQNGYKTMISTTGVYLWIIEMQS